MTIKHIAIAATAFAAAFTAPAHAVAISVNNFSFETLPAGGLPNAGCGAGCSYSNVTAPPGWVLAGDGGQFQPGPVAGNFAYFSYIPDGITVAYSNGGTFYQTVTPLAQLGATYTLKVDVGQRFDTGSPQWVGLNFAGSNTTIYASGAAAPAGGWSTYTSVFTVGAADAGSAITIVLNSYGAQGNWDNVRLDGTVPEPASWALMIAGLGMVGAAMRRRKAVAV